MFRVIFDITYIVRYNIFTKSRTEDIRIAKQMKRTKDIKITSFSFSAYLSFYIYRKKEW